MIPFRADLHCHTTCSDGTLTPQELITLAAEQGFNAIAITDHDTIDGYQEAAALFASQEIAYISGVEFSTIHLGVSVHILAYAFSIDSPIIQSFCAAHQARREQRMLEMLALLKKHRMPITEEELYGKRNTKRGIGRPHLAQAMVDKGYVATIAEAFRKYIGEGRSCYAIGKPNSVEETLDCIKQANGFAVIAHPHLVNNAKVLKQLFEMPFDGIECFYARFGIEQSQRWVNMAEKKGWLMLGGSDFHGSIKPSIPLGCSWTPEETFRILQNRFIQNQIRE